MNFTIVWYKNGKRQTSQQQDQTLDSARQHAGRLVREGFADRAEIHDADGTLIAQFPITASEQ